ncbi:MAG: hypothetical protein ACREGR_00380, partial [Minisyncoccia bacterium]
MKQAQRLFWSKLEERAQAEKGKPFGKCHHLTRPKLYAAVLGDLVAFGDLPVGSDPEKQVWPGVPTFLPDCTDFTDISVKDKPAEGSGMGDHCVLCPKCHGHGYYN